jgi:hypothetical protein
MLLLMNKFSVPWLRIPKAASFSKLRNMEGLLTKQWSDRPDRRNGHEPLQASTHIVSDRRGRILTVRLAEVQTQAEGYAVWKPLRRPKLSSK